MMITKIFWGIQPNEVSKNRDNTICAAWIQSKENFKKTLEKNNLDITNIQVLYRFEELANGAYDNRLRHTLRVIVLTLCMQL